MNTPVSYELAKLLKAKGFEQDAFKHINKATMEGTLVFPSIAEVIMWFYEKRNLWITVIPINSQAFSRVIWENKIIDVTNNCNDYSDFTFHYTSTEAYEAAIEYALKEVIN